jgi:DNA-directed RNA polymerase
LALFLPPRSFLYIYCTFRHLLPAFYTLFRAQGRLLREEVKPHPILARLFRGAAQEDLLFEMAAVPMLCPPLPWTSVATGGYLLVKEPLIRQVIACFHSHKHSKIVDS